MWEAMFYFFYFFLFFVVALEFCSSSAGRKRRNNSWERAERTHTHTVAHSHKLSSWSLHIFPSYRTHTYTHTRHTLLSFRTHIHTFVIFTFFFFFLPTHTHTRTSMLPFFSILQREHTLTHLLHFSLSALSPLRHTWSQWFAVDCHLPGGPAGRRAVVVSEMSTICAESAGCRFFCFFFEGLTYQRSAKRLVTLGYTLTSCFLKCKNVEWENMNAAQNVFTGNRSKLILNNALVKAKHYNWVWAQY